MIQARRRARALCLVGYPSRMRDRISQNIDRPDIDKDKALVEEPRNCRKRWVMWAGVDVLRRHGEDGKGGWMAMVQYAVEPIKDAIEKK